MKHTQLLSIKSFKVGEKAKSLSGIIYEVIRKAPTFYEIKNIETGKLWNCNLDTKCFTKIDNF